MEILSDTLDSHMGAADMAFRFLAAALLAAVIGLNREWRHKPAGLKTHILVSLAACAFAVLAVEITQEVAEFHPESQSDPVRVIEAVVKGVAFLGAGVIIQARGSVVGLTTGASLLVAGAIGLAAGMGKLLVALLVLACALAVLTVVRALEKRVRASTADSGGDRDRDTLES